MGQDQEADIMYYSTELEAERIMEDLESTFKSPARVGNVVYGFDAEPTDQERETIQHCVEAPSSD